MNFKLKKLCFAKARATGIFNKMLNAMLKLRYNQRILETMFKHIFFTYENLSLSQEVYI